jgi:hypothetical protein
MNEVFKANDTLLSWVLLNHGVVYQRDGLILNLFLSTFQNERERERKREREREREKRERERQGERNK